MDASLGFYRIGLGSSMTDPGATSMAPWQRSAFKIDLCHATCTLRLVFKVRKGRSAWMFIVHRCPLSWCTSTSNQDKSRGTLRGASTLALWCWSGGSGLQLHGPVVNGKACQACCANFTNVRHPQGSSPKFIFRVSKE